MKKLASAVLATLVAGLTAACPDPSAGLDAGLACTPLARCKWGCTDLQTDDLNCGSCGERCGDTKSCVKGMCYLKSCAGKPCAAGEVCVSNACVDKACVDCPAGQVCAGGTCKSSCVPNAACTPTNPCKTGATSCTTGTAVCEESGNVEDGTSCGDTGQRCEEGECTTVDLCAEVTCPRVCDPATGSCVACLKESDCTSSSRPHCDTATKRCVAATAYDGGQPLVDAAAGCTDAAGEQDGGAIDPGDDAGAPVDGSAVSMTDAARGADAASSRDGGLAVPRDAGAGLDASGACADPCLQPGAVECASGAIRTCIASPGGCLAWGAPSGCADGFCIDARTCSEGGLSLVDAFNRSPVVLNAAWQPLPTSWTSAGLTSGMAGVVNPQSSFFEDGTTVSDKALFALPSTHDGDFTEIVFSNLNLYRPKIPWFNARVGIARKSPNTSAGVRITVLAQADQKVSSDPPWEVLSTHDLPKGVVWNIWTPLGLWPLRENFVLALRFEKLGANNADDVVLIDNPRVYYHFDRPLLAVNNSSSYVNSDDFQSDPALVQQAGVRRIRTFAPHTSWSGGNAATLAALMNSYYASLQAIIATNPSVKFDLLVMQESDDIPSPVLPSNCYDALGNRFDAYYGFGQIDLSRFATRVDGLLAQHKSRGIPLEVVELGNELDLVYSNADVVCPAGYAPNPNSQAVQSNFEVFIRKYAGALAITYQATKAHYPDAKVITFGAATHKAEWAPYTYNVIEILRRLQNVSGVNYLSRFADGIGLHVYPSSTVPATASAQVLEMLTSFSAGVPAGKPIWITEFGFHRDSFGACSSNGRPLLVDCQDRYQALKAVVSALNSFPGDRPVAAGYVYVFGQENSRASPPVSNPWSLTFYDGSYQLGLFGEARLFGDYPY